MDRFIEVDEAVQLTGKSVRTLYRLVTSIKRKEGKDLKSIKQEKVEGKTKTFISLEALQEAYGIKGTPKQESEQKSDATEAGFYKTILQEKDRHINYLEKEIEVKNQQINSFQSQVENYQVIIQSKIPQLSEPTVNKGASVEGVEVAEGAEATEQTSVKEIVPSTNSKKKRNRIILLIATIIVSGIAIGIGYAYLNGYLKFS